MRKILFSLTAVLAFSLVFILITAEKPPENRKFYYAFNEKIFIDEIPNKFAVKFKDKQKANALKLYLIEKVGNEKKIQSQNETTLIVDLNSTGKNINELLNSKMLDIEIIKPAYKYQKQEMYYTNEILVEPLEGINISDVIRKNGLENYGKVKEGKFYSIVEISPIFDACEIANKIQESGLVKYSHPNFMMPIEKHQVIPNDTYFNNQYYLRNTGQVFNPVENHFGLANADINAPFAWNTTLGNNAIIVAVIDAGVTPNHPDLPNVRQVRLNGSNFVSGENANDPTPGLHHNHGNACSGIIAGTQNNNEGVTGIAPNVRIMPIKIFGGDGINPGNNADNNGVAAAIDFAWQNGAHVISNSWGYGSDNPNFVPAIVAAINRAVTQGRGNLGSVVVFSASNSANHSLGNNGQIRFPSNVLINGVLTVGASDRDDEQSDYSPTSNAANPNNQMIDIVAPSHRAYPPAFGGIPGEGFEVWTIDIPGVNGYNQWNDPNFPITAPAFGEVLPTAGVNNLSYTGRMGGTSASCPQVAAVAALVLSLNNNLTQQQVFDIITQSADDVGGYAYTAGWCPELGNGRLNACAALSRIPGRFTITGTDFLCTSSTYSINNLPQGSIVNWGSSNNNIATISPTGLATKVGNGTVTFTATINIPNRCGGQIILTKPNVVVGTPVPLGINGPSHDLCYDGRTSEIAWFYVVNPINSLTYYWQIDGQGAGIGSSIRVDAFRWDVGNHQIRVRSYSSACGYSAWYTSSFIVIDCSSNRFTVSPNPSSDNINISVNNSMKYVSKQIEVREVELIDKMGSTRYKKQFGNGLTSANISVSNLPNDIYTLRIFDGEVWHSYKISIQH
ncbi:MAG: S8 family serine peptidase [Chitinophagaceae bacterium]|nr:S8 family serine peptidase [Chitinophagaceae bacterium]